MSRKLLDRDESNAQINGAVLDLLSQQLNRNGLSGSIIGVLFVYAMYNGECGPAMLIWVGLIIALSVIRAFFFNYMDKARKSEKHSFQLFHQIIILFLFLSGLTWGTGAYLFSPKMEEVEIFVTFISFFLLISLSSIFSCASSIQGSLAFFVPTMLGMIVALYQDGYTMLFTITLIALIMFIISSVNFSKFVMNAIRFDMENKTLLGKVTIEKQRAEQEKRKADQANNEKSRFMAAASHDLRQPLNSMGLFIYALRKKMQSHNNESLPILESIDDAHKALNGLFDALLEISQLDSATVIVKKKSMSLDMLLQPLVAELSEQAKAKGLALTYTKLDIDIISDPLLLTRVLRNLIGNAIKYTEQGHIAINVTRVDDLISIKITDTGIGIPQSQFELIFDEYQQLSNKRRDRRQGIGLGLSIVKKTCELLEHQINVSSQIGKGSTFEIVATVCKQPIAVKPIESLQRQNKHSLSATQVLVIDDDPDILSAMQLILNGWHCDVNIAGNYVEACQQIAQQRPDIILCDYRLQDDMNGVEVLQAINLKSSTEIPALIITGETEPLLLQTVQQLGFKVLNKPIKANQLKIEMVALLADR